MSAQINDFFIQAYWLVNRHQRAGFYSKNSQDLIAHWQIIAKQLAAYSASPAALSTSYNWGWTRLVEGDFGYEDLGDAFNVAKVDAQYNPNQRRLKCFTDAMAQITQTNRTWQKELGVFTKDEQAIITKFWQPPLRSWYDDKQTFYPNLADGVATVAPINTSYFLERINKKPVSNEQLLSLALC